MLADLGSCVLLQVSPTGSDGDDINALVGDDFASGASAAVEKARREVSFQTNAASYSHHVQLPQVHFKYTPCSRPKGAVFMQHITNVTKAAAKFFHVIVERQHPNTALFHCWETFVKSPVMLAHLLCPHVCQV
jgi:hypothetical protein